MLAPVERGTERWTNERHSITLKDVSQILTDIGANLFRVSHYCLGTGECFSSATVIVVQLGQIPDHRLQNSFQRSSFQFLVGLMHLFQLLLQLFHLLPQPRRLSLFGKFLHHSSFPLPTSLPRSAGFTYYRTSSVGLGRANEEWGTPVGTKRPSSAETNLVTRTLCATTYLRDQFAEDVHSILCTDSVKAIAPTPGLDLLALARHARNAYLIQTVRRVTSTICGLMLLLGLILLIRSVLTTSGELARLALVLLIAAPITAWLLDGVLATHARRTSLRVIVRPNPARELAPALPAEHERLLEDVNAPEANVVIFDEHDAGESFVDCGFLIQGRRQSEIQISQPARKEEPLNRLTLPILLEHLEDAFRRGLEKVTVQQVLYVPGQRAQHVRELSAGPGRSSGCVVPASIVHKLAQQDPSLRDYLQIRSVSDDGNLVFTLSVHPMISRGYLIYEVKAHVTPPLLKLFDSARTVDTHRLRRTLQPFKQRPRMIFWNMLAAPFWLAGQQRARLKHNRDVRRVRRNRSYTHDLGSDYSLRILTSGHWRMTDAHSADAVAWFSLAERVLTDSTLSLLKQHNISTHDLDKRSDLFNTINIGMVTQSAIGSNAKFFNYGEGPDSDKGDNEKKS